MCCLLLAGTGSQQHGMVAIHILFAGFGTILCTVQLIFIQQLQKKFESLFKDKLEVVGFPYSHMSNVVKTSYKSGTNESAAGKSQILVAFQAKVRDQTREKECDKFGSNSSRALSFACQREQHLRQNYPSQLSLRQLELLVLLYPTCSIGRTG
jgi:hypothetical protein